MKTSEILNKAADMIEANGWGCGPLTWLPGGGRGLCLEGGIAAAMEWPVDPPNQMPASHIEFSKCPAYSAMQDYLAAGRRLWVWNDAFGRTAEEVIEALRACAVIEAAKEEAAERESAGV